MLTPCMNKDCKNPGRWTPFIRLHVKDDPRKGFEAAISERVCDGCKEEFERDGYKSVVATLMKQIEEPFSDQGWPLPDAESATVRWHDHGEQSA